MDVLVPMAALLIEPIASSWIQPVNSSLINAITGKGVTRTGKRQGRFLLLLSSITFNYKSFWEKEVQEQGKDIITWIILIKLFTPLHPLRNIKIY